MTIKDDLIKHKIFLQRLTKNQAKPMLSQINKLKGISEALIKESKLSVIKDKVSKILLPAITPSLKKLEDLANYEQKYLVKTLSRYGVNAVAKVNKAAFELPMTTSLIKEGVRVEEAYKKFVNSKAEQLTQSVRDSRTTNKTEEETSVLFLGLLTGLVTYQTLNLANISINHIAENVKIVLLDGVVDYVEWVALLDNTCETCESYHGEIYPIDDLPDTIPVHVNCNCSVIPVLDSE